MTHTQQMRMAEQQGRNAPKGSANPYSLNREPAIAQAWLIANLSA